MKIANGSKIEKRWYAAEGYSRDDMDKIIDLQEVDVAVSEKTVRVASRGVRGLIKRQWSVKEFQSLSLDKTGALRRLYHQLTTERESAGRRIVELDLLLLNVVAMIKNEEGAT